MTTYLSSISATASATRARLGGVELGRLAVRHRAVAARTGADVAENHERRRPVVPALTDVRAARLLADGVELAVAHHALEPQVVRRPGRAHLQPLGLGCARDVRGRCPWAG